MSAVARHVQATSEIFLLEHGLATVLRNLLAIVSFKDLPQAGDHALVRVAGVALVLQLQPAPDVGLGFRVRVRVMVRVRA